MRNVPALTAREVHSAFFSPMAYLVLTLFLFFSGFFFYLILASTRQATMGGLIQVMFLLFLVAMPLLTMRLMSEEYRTGTIETLMTAPVTDAEVILGKFFGAMIFFLAMILPTLLYVLVLRRLGEPDLGPVLSAYVGLVLMGAMFTALGLFCSAVTRYQIVAGVMAVVALLILWIMGAVGEYIGGEFGPMLQYIGTHHHMLPYTQGRIPFRDSFYFLSMTGFWLFLATRVLESRRWRG